MELNSSTQPLVSVIMNCHNSAEFLKDAINSVFAQTYTNFEVIFWDNASTDDSASIAKSYDERMKYFYSSDKTSLGEARNLACSKAQGEYLAFLDCDDLWLPTKLEKQIPLFKSSNIGLVYSDAIFFNDSGTEITSSKNTPLYRGDVSSQLLTNYFICLQTVVIRKSMLDRLEYMFNPDFSMIEEADLFRRLSFICHFDYHPEPLAKWRMHPNSFTFKNPEAFSNESRQMIEIYKKQIPNFDTKYSKEIETLNTQIQINDAKLLWMEGKNNKARKRFKSLFGKSKKAIAFYILAFLSINSAQKIIRLFGRGIG